MRYTLTGLRRRLAATRASRAARDFLAVFNYHQVSPVFDPVRHAAITWTALDHFARQLDVLTDRFELISLREGIRRLRSGSLRGPCAALTFDDGDISLRDHVTPLLVERRAPATYFVNTAHLDDGPLPWFNALRQLATRPEGRALLDGELRGAFETLRTTGDPERYRELRGRVAAAADVPAEVLFVSREFLASLDVDLFTVALHGHEHERFSLMPTAWRRADLERNAAALRDLPAYEPIFAVPFGRPHDWDDALLDLAREMGLTVVLADGGLNQPGQTSADTLDRIPADGERVVALLRRQLAGF